MTAVIPDVLASALVTAAKLVDDLDGQRRREEATYGEGYRAGYRAGFDVGEGSVYEKIAEGSRLAAKALGPTDAPALAELLHRRAEPGPAALAWRARHGAEHQGGPVPWGRVLPEDWPVGPPSCPSCGWPPNDRHHCCRHRRDGD